MNLPLPRAMRARGRIAAALLAPCLALLALAAAPASAADAYPNKPIKLIVPFPPGGSADGLARPFTQQLEKRLGQPIVIDNRGGGLTVIGAEAAAKSPPDGYNLFLMPGTHVLSPLLVKNVRFDPIKDYTPVSLLATIPYVFYTKPGRPYATMKDMIAYARANPGKVSVGTTDAISRAAVEDLNARAGVKLVNVNYKGAGQVATDVIGGHLDVGIITPTGILGPYQDKRIVGLGISGSSRVPVMPEIPTVAEALGLPGYAIQTWFVLSGPAGLPPDVVARLAKDTDAVMRDEELRKNLVNLGFVPVSDTSTAAAMAMMRSFQDTMNRLVKEAGITPE